MREPVGEVQSTNAADQSSATGSEGDGGLTLSESLDQMKQRFSGEMSGARQAPRSHLVRFLAATLAVAEQQAERAMERLQDIGVIGRRHESAAAVEGRHANGWTIETTASNDQELAKIEADVRGHVDSIETNQYGAAVELLRRAISARATDIHLDPYDDEVEVRFRIDGRLRHFCRLNDLVAARTIAQLKLMAELDVAEPFEPQEGRLELPASLGEYAARITVVPVDGGEAVAVRLLSRERLIRPLAEMGFSVNQRPVVQRLLKCREGIVLVAGPTGSGKTTTLYSLLHALDGEDQNIITIEDPIEFHIPSLLQMEVDLRHNVTPARALKTVLRMDPDVVMVGEIRDAEAAALALRASDTGTFVLSTVHARDAASMLTAMRDLHVDERSLASNLRAVISQRLVRKVCQHCKVDRPLADKELRQFELADVTPPDAIVQAKGCQRCDGAGYFDRVGVYEVVENTPAIAAAIQEGATEAKLRSMFREAGIPNLAADGLQKVADGMTDFEEIQRMTWVAPAASSPDSTEHDSNARTAFWEI